MSGKRSSDTSKRFAKISGFLLMLPFLLTGALCGFFCARAAGSLSAENADAGDILITCALLLLSMYAGILLQITVHEAGHLVCGLISGYSFSSFRIGNFMFVKQDGKIKLRRFSLMDTGGQCLMTPPAVKNGAYPFILYNLGGCAANILLSLAALAASAAAGDVKLLPEIMLLTAAVGIGFALANGIPLRSGAIDNDGRNTLTLIKNPQARRAMWIQLHINELISRGVRLKDLPQDLLFVPPLSEMTDSLTSALGVFECSRFIDELDFSAALTAGTRILEQDIPLAGVHRYMLTAEMIFCRLITGKNTDEIELMFGKELQKFIKSSLSSLPSSSRFMYAYQLLYKHDEAEAARALKTFEKAAGRYPNRGEIEGERELIEIIRQKSRESSS